MTEKKKDFKKATAGRAGGLVGGKVKSEAKIKAARTNIAKAAPLGSQTKSAAKVHASRANGLKGGRPNGLPGSTEQAQKAAAARAAKLSPEKRREIALTAVAAREAKRKKHSQ